MPSFEGEKGVPKRLTQVSSRCGTVRAGHSRARPLRLRHLPRLKASRPVQRGSGEFHHNTGVSKQGERANHLVLMVKAPVAGGVKTRLARGVGAARAASFYRSVTNTVLSRLVRPGKWRTYLAVAPDNAVMSRAWPFSVGGSHVVRVMQGGGDLGARMQRVMDGMPSGPVVIVGSDIPQVSASHIERAFCALSQADAVFGPSPDGGYWLVGLRRSGRVARAFDNVRWSSATTLDDTLLNLDGLSVEQIDVLADVDEASDLAAMGAVVGRRILPR